MDAGGDTNQTAIMDGGSTAGLPSSRHICGLPARRLSAFASTTAEGWRSRERRAAKYGWTRSFARLIRAARDVPQHYRGVWLRQPSRSTRRRDVRRSEALAFSLRRFLSGTTSRRAANRNFPGSNSYFDFGQRPVARSSALWASRS